MFPTFPSGSPGVGLLLLRAALGITLCAEGAAYASDWHQLGLVSGAVCLLKILGGISLVIGYLTPLAGVLAVLLRIGSAFSWFPVSSLTLIDTKFSTALVAVIAIAVVCLGPGAYSLDARLFGRREIIIPSGPPSSKL